MSIRRPTPLLAALGVAATVAATLAAVIATQPAGRQTTHPVTQARAAAPAPSAARTQSGSIPGAGSGLVPVATCADTPGRFRCMSEHFATAIAPPVRFEPTRTAAPAAAHPAGRIEATEAPSNAPTAHPVATAGPIAGPARGSAIGYGYGPDDLRAAYDVPASTTTATVAVVDAYDNPSVEADLAAYRSYYGLPPCTSANGCFTKVNQNGDAGPLPSYNAAWAGEIDLDVQMVSAICPTCHILLVEGDDAGSGLFTAVRTAARLGARYVSLSWAARDYKDEMYFDSRLFDPGVTYVAAGGDDGYGAMWPAVSPDVVGVGGTTLRRAPGTSRGFSETVWGQDSTGGAGSGCSRYEPQPSWQAANATIAAACPGHAAHNAVSVVANPLTGVVVYTASGWRLYGGTSAGAPMVAAMYAMTGESAGTHAAAYAYAHPRGFNDVTSGANGTCSVTVLCTAGPGWDGPTGLGTPRGLAALADVSGLIGYAKPAPTPSAPPSTGSGSSGSSGPPTSSGPPSAGGPSEPPHGPSLTITGPDDQRDHVGNRVRLRVQASAGAGTGAGAVVDGSPSFARGATAPDVDGLASAGAAPGSALDIHFTAKRLPPGARIDPATGAITGRLRGPGTYQVWVTATDAHGANASTGFTWQVAANRLVPSRGAVIHGNLVRGGRVHVAHISWHLNSRDGRVVQPRVRCQWYVNGRAIHGADSCSFTIRHYRGYVGARLTVRVTASARNYTPTTLASAARVVRR